MAVQPQPCSRGSGSQTERPANWSSLLFSCGGVNFLVYLAFHGLAEGIFAFFMEGNAIHRNLFYISVEKLVAFAQKVGARLRVGDHCDHAVRRAHDAIQ